MTVILLLIAAAGLLAGAAAVFWPIPATAPVTTPGRYARRIAGAMVVGASLFLGGFVLAFAHFN
jgi:hypothetical protein